MSEINIIDQAYIVPNYIPDYKYSQLMKDNANDLPSAFVDELIADNQSIVMDVVRAAGYDVSVILGDPDRILKRAVAVLTAYQLYARKEAVPGPIKEMNDWVLNVLLPGIQNKTYLLGDPEDESEMPSPLLKANKTADDIHLPLSKLDAVFPLGRGGGRL